jgi:hypothetical protein
MLWLVLLPFRLLFAVVFGLVALPVALVILPFALLLWLPFLLLKVVFRVAAGLILLPLIIAGGLLGLVLGGVAIAALFIPLVPLLLLALLAWALLRPRMSTAW